MANRSVFPTKPVAAADTVNDAGGAAIRMSPRHALAQFAVTGCFSDTYYVSAGDQLDRVKAICGEVDPGFIAKAAVYARKRSHMKDAPAYLLAHLASVSIEDFKRAFPIVIDNTKMLRTFVQILRSGACGRKSMGTAVKRAVQRFLLAMPVNQLFYGSVGDKPSLGDIIKMVHPKPLTSEQGNLFRYLAKGEYVKPNAPLVEHYEAFKDAPRSSPNAVPPVPFQMLDSLGIGTAEWTSIARSASWQTTRMNLNTFARHGVFQGDPETIDAVSRRLADPEQIARARVFPYQLLMAYMACDAAVPIQIQMALQQAMEHATANVPAIAGNLLIFPDVSGSMCCAITGHRVGSTSKMRCVDVAALFAATLVRKNPTAMVLPFDTQLHPLRLNPMDSIMTNAAALAKFGGGGTCCELPLRAAINGWAGDGRCRAVIYISDNESWFGPRYGRTTGLEYHWDTFKRQHPGCKLVCIDLVPNSSVQVQDRPDVLNVGGFSDAVFEVVSNFLEGRHGADYWVQTIESIDFD